MDIKKIYEDNEIIVLDKPAGVIVNRANTHDSLTIQDYVEDSEFLEAEADGASLPKSDYPSDFQSRSGIVHRLDKDTSGVLLVAKTSESYNILQRQFKDRAVEKKYRAVIFGELPSEECEINAPIGRNPKNRLRMAVVSDGKDAMTFLKFDKKGQVAGQKISLITAIPATGRTHQIRVHLAALSCQVVGDPLYDTKKQYEFSLTFTDRMLLHAEALSIIHPKSRQQLTFTSKLPQEFLSFF